VGRFAKPSYKDWETYQVGRFAKPSYKDWETYASSGPAVVFSLLTDNTVSFRIPELLGS
jgi:hypothetical protein